MKLNRRNLFLASSAVITLTLSSPAAHAGNGTWNVDASDNWSTAANWNPAVVPGTTAGDVIGLTNNITANSTVTIDTTSRTAGILNLGDSDDTHAFTLAASGGASLTLDNSGGGAQINKTGSIADTISAPIILAENLAVTAVGALQISGDISGTGTLTKLGSGILTLSGNNSYIGGTIIDTGRILATNSNAFGSGNVSISTGAGRQLRLGNGVDISNALTIAGGASAGVVAEGILYAVGNATYSGNILINGAATTGGLIAAATGQTLTLNGNITSSVELTVRNGTVILNGTGSSYSAMNNQGATIRLGANDAIPVGVNFQMGGSASATLDLNGFNQSLVGITKGTNAATIGSSSISANSVLTTTGTSTYAGTIVDVIPLSGGNRTVGLTVASGALTLSGTNTYTGPTAISGGTLFLNNVSALGTTSAISMAAGAILQANLTGISTAAPITLSGAGNVQIAAGTITPVLASFTGGITGTTTTLTFTTVNTSNPSHVITLGAASNYAGDTTITVGLGNNNLTVRAGGTNSLSPATVLTMGGDAGSDTASGRVSAYDLNGNNQTLAGLFNTTAGHSTSRNQRMTNSGALATLTIDNSVACSYGGAHTDGGGTGSAQITGALALTKNGIGTFTLGGPLGGTAVAPGNSFTGDTKILGGTLSLGESNSIQNSAFDTASSIAGTGSAGLLTTVTTLTLGGLTGGNSFASRFTSATGGPGNVTANGGYNALTALTLNPGTGVVNTYASDIGNGAGSMTLTKTGAGTQVLSVANTYTGGTNINAGALEIGHPDALGTSGSIFFAGGTLKYGTGITTDLSSRFSAGASQTVRVDTNGENVTFATPLPSSAGSLTKLGAETLTLTGLSATAASNYSGATIIDQGTLKFTTTSPTLTGGLTFGSLAGGTNTGTLDLSTASATFGGALLVQTNSASANSISIGSSQTLQLNGAVTVGYNSAANTTTKLDVAGVGTLSIGTVGTATNANVQIGNGATSNISNAGTLDMSGLSTFYANLGAGTFRVGSITNSGGASTGGSTAILADDSTIRATSLIVASPDTPTSIQRLKLGSGTNVLNVNDIFVAGRGPVNADGRSGGQLTFNEVTGSLTIRGLAGGVTRANLSVASSGQNTGNSAIGLFDSTGHTADLRLGTLTVGARTTNSGGSTSNGTFNFDTGTLDADNFIAGFRDNGQGVIGTVNLSGGTATFNNTTAAIVLGSNVAGGNVAFVATGTLNISGSANVTVAAPGGTSIQLGNAFVLGTATGNVNITGNSTLTVAGDIIRGATTGVSVATVKIAGGTLNMGGNDIGAAGLGAVTLTAESGTLSNVATINGTGGLTKTTAGSLTLSGNNTYTGDTTVSGGVLAVSGTSIANTGKLDIAGGKVNLTNTETVNTLFFGGVQQAAGNYTSADPSTNFTGLGTLTVLTGPAGFSGWITGTFINGSVPALQQGPNADPDNDGISNLVEYAIAGQDPTVSNATVGSFNGTLLSFSKRLDATGLTYAIQDSTDLGLADAWAPVGSYTQNDASTISYTLTPGTPAKNFLRLQVLSN